MGVGENLSRHNPNIENIKEKNLEVSQVPASGE